MKTVQRVIRDVPQHWVGDGFPVRSLFSYVGRNEFDPFLLLDYAGPHDFAPDEAKRGVGEHPHRGFETVTILYQGELEHRDSSGSRGAIGPGDVQWMTAASGVVHEEFHSRRFANEGGTLEMVQLWVNLRSTDKTAPPKYQDLRDDQFPRVVLPDDAGTVRVIAGELGDAKGPASTFSPINLWDVQLTGKAATTLTVPSGHTCVVIVQRGKVQVNESSIQAVELALLERSGDSVVLEAKSESRVLLMTGEPLGEPVVGQGPFVMNTREEIRAAIADYQAGKMGRLD
ncbi:pirin family protein [Rhodopirellula europaea]|uniref:Pirin family protein n=1 Tax=Rhodopirellula europaea 6C TaxID=1263867 RepID=M2AKN3_9BACT|nr:pirin family protein [Rhodopirellula europaea]EMB13262.1 pirin family protein [Rhodopirellula europaea 6C]